MSAGVTAQIIMPGDVLWPNRFPDPGPEYMIHNTHCAQSRKQQAEECCGCMATVIIISP